MNVIDTNDWLLSASLLLFLVVALKSREENVDSRPEVVHITRCRRKVSTEFGIVRFLVVWLEAGYRVYLVQGFDYTKYGRSPDGRLTHRYQDKDGQIYVCWSGRISTIEEANAVILLFTRGSIEYLKNGQWPIHSQSLQS